MLLAIFILLSVPLGLFTAWFAWRAWQVRRMNVARAMAFLSFCCLATALIVGTWLWLALQA